MQCLDDDVSLARSAPKRHSSVPALAALLSLAAGSSFGQGMTDLASALRPADEAHQIVTLHANGDGSQSLGARLVAGSGGVQIGRDVLFDLTGIWGTDGIAIEAIVSSRARPGSVILLTDDFILVELAGIWGTDGVAVPPPEDIRVAGPLFDPEKAGTATVLLETVRPFADPSRRDSEAVLLVGTSTGKAGVVLVPDVDEWLPAPDPNVPQVDEWYAPAHAASLDAPVESVASVVQQVPGRKELYVAALGLSEGVVHGLHPGYSASPGFDPVPPFPVFALRTVPGATAIRGLARQPPPEREPSLPADGTFPLVSIDGTTRVQTARLPQASSGLLSFDPASTSSVEVGVPLAQLALGSLVALSEDAQSLLFAPDFDPGTGTLGGPVLTLATVSSVEFQPRSLNRKSKGRSVKVTIEARGDDAVRIATGSLRLGVEGDPRSPLAPLSSGFEDDDDDGNLELVAKFDRKALLGRLGHFEPGDRAILVVEWTSTAGDTTATTRVRIVK